MKQKNYIPLKKSYPSIKGFTLIEFFVSITIFSFIALSLILTLNIALKAYKISKGFENEDNILTSIISGLKEELNATVPELENGKFLYGSAESLYFCAPYFIENEKYPLYKITYEIKKSPEKGLYFIKKFENPFKNIGKSEEEHSFFEQKNQYIKSISYLLTNTKEISFEYLNIVKDKDENIISNWVSVWNFDYMPSAIKIKIKDYDKNNKEILLKLRNFIGTDLEEQEEEEGEEGEEGEIE